MRELGWALWVGLGSVCILFCTPSVRREFREVFRRQEVVGEVKYVGVPELRYVGLEYGY